MAVTTTGNKGTGGYFQVKENDWEELNRALRYVYDTLDRLSGRRGSIALGASLDLNGHRVTNAGEPTASSDVVTKNYADQQYLKATAASLRTIETASSIAQVFDVRNEVPSGAIDGINKVFTLLNLPITDSVSLFLKGVLQELGPDYTLSGKTITMALPPLAGSYLRVFYQY